ncbi:MAG: hypothetical protein Devi2KO_15160 [Devosia indica]
MKKLLLLMPVAFVAMGLVAYFAGVRVFVIQPIGAVPKGVTAIVTGSPGLRFIDSPDAFCMREQGYVNLLCRGMIADRVAQNGSIILRLPYNDALYALSGAPALDR